MTSSLAFLKGDRIFLRQLIDDDVNGPYVNWFNDIDISYGNSHHMFPFSSEDALIFIRQSRAVRNELVLAIITNDSNRHIGNIALQNIHPVYHSAEFSILLGEKDYWNKGYGKEAGKLLCDHGFFHLNLHRISCGTFNNNIAMKNLAQALGMKEEGTRKEAAFIQGRYIDVVEYGVLRKDYVKFWDSVQENIHE